MKPASPELRALLATRQFFAADLYTFNLIDGGVLRYCGGDQDLTANGYLHPAGGLIGPYFDRKDNKAKCHWKVGVEVDTLVVDVIPGSATVDGDAFLDSVRKGIFDQADVTLEKVFMPTYGDTRRGTVMYFVGRVAEIDAGRSVATFSINSHLELANLQMPRNLYQPNCINSLGDASCQATIPSTTGTVTSGSTTGAVNASVTNYVSYTTGQFNLGKITFTSGTLNGLTFGVRSTSIGASSTIATQEPMPIAPSVGDTFTLYYGCDKSLGANGCPKFSNQPRFRGAPWVPQPATAA